MPVPMMTPTPNTVRSSPDRCFLSRCSGSSVSRIESSTDFTRRVASGSRSPPRGVRPGERRTGASEPACLRCRCPTSGRSEEVGGMSSDTSSSVPRPLTAGPDGPVARPPSASRRAPPDAGPGRPAELDLVVDCAVYVDGQRIEPGRPARRAAGGDRDAAASSGSGSTSRRRPSSARSPRRYGLHPLAVEDAVYAHQRPKLEHYDDGVFMVLKTATYVEHEELTATSEVVETGEIMVFLGANYVITVRHGDHGALTELRRSLEKQRDLLCLGPGGGALRRRRPRRRRLRRGGRRGGGRRRRARGLGVQRPSAPTTSAGSTSSSAS